MAKNTNIFSSKDFQNIPTLGFLVWKYTVRQPCPWIKMKIHYVMTFSDHFCRTNFLQNCDAPSWCKIFAIKARVAFWSASLVRSYIHTRMPMPMPNHSFYSELKANKKAPRFEPKSSVSSRRSIRVESILDEKVIICFSTASHDKGCFYWHS
jgi:hypothetical protein